MSRKMKSLRHNLNDADEMKRPELEHREQRSRKGRDPRYQVKRTWRVIRSEKSKKWGRQTLHRIKKQLS
jgi:hypothetical protein